MNEQHDEPAALPASPEDEQHLETSRQAVKHKSLARTVTHFDNPFEPVASEDWTSNR